VRNHQRNEIKVGITVLAGLIVVLVGFSLLKEWTLTSKTYTLKMRFETSAGLQSGDQVTVNGVKAGKVEAVAMDGHEVLVDANIDAGFRLASDARPVIQMLELMGGKKIEIKQGVSATEFNTAEVMYGTVDPDIAGALSMVGELRGTVNSLTSKADTLLDNLNGITGDKALLASVRETMTNLAALSRDMKTLVEDNRRTGQDMLRTAARVSRRLDTLLTDLPPRLNRELQQADRLLTGADTLVNDLRSVVSDIRTSRGLMNTMISDTTMPGKMDAMLRKLDSLASVIIDGQLRIKLRL
jgi:phospholipid/cholesterol/gamma-HCH transport system substrate-binding protein